jgi:ABC-type multidrug transport system ATPase subunit
VILSTHIVEDVRTLCTDFAIICQGELLRHDKPEEAVEELNGKIYVKSVEKSAIAALREEEQVISVQMKSGGLSVRIFSDSTPGDGFVAVPPILEDVYFHQISGKVDVVTI